MVESSNRLFESLGDGMKKLEKNETEAVIVQRRALRFKRKMQIGEVIKKEDIIPLRPAPIDCLKPNELNLILGKSLKANVEKEDLVRLELFL
jgi:N-acetylneuraminate synthase